LEDGWADLVVAGLALNFVPDIGAALAEMRRVAAPGAVIGAYVWDYGGEMQLIRRLFDAAIALDPDAEHHDEGKRFPICAPGGLRSALETAGLRDVVDDAIEIPTVFRAFDDFWTPFLGGVGPAPAYVVSLNEDARVRLRERLRSTLPTETDGSIHLVARAWAARGAVPGRSS
jgi:SAM-dependent methyltransferase